MSKKIFTVTVVAVISLWAMSAHAFIALPFFNITINEHTQGGDGTFTFDIEGGSPQNFFSEHSAITTSSGVGSVSTSSISPNGATFIITQDSISGWNSPTVVCTSTNPAVTSTQTDIGDGIIVVGAPFSSVVCDFANEKATAGVSNVLFIPGFEGSRLYTSRPFIQTEDQLWEPNSNTDVADLGMGANGKSLNTSVYTRDILDESNILPVAKKKLYKLFGDSLNQMVSSGTMAAWAPAPYDWRYDPEYVVNHGVVSTTTGAISYLEEIPNGQTPFMISEIEALARTSKTGKVTIVTHSNGGLIVKALIKKLETEHSPDLAKIDTVIMVAAPQLGTPDAIGKILHGFQMGFGGGFLMGKPIARYLAKNAPGAYALLPGEQYFNTVSDPVVVFDPRIDVLNNFRLTYGNSITNHESFTNFLSGTLDKRTDPLFAETGEPLVLNPSLLASARNVHADIDMYQLPESIHEYKIAGWGRETPSGILYTTRPACGGGHIPLNHCPVALDEKMILTHDGDKTVVSPSAVYGAGVSYYFNLQDYNEVQGENYGHADIFEAQPVIETIQKILSHEASLSPYITLAKPNTFSDSLVLSTHSPVLLGITDASGRHTGASEDQLLPDFEQTDEEIPNSSYLPFGEGTYISAPSGNAYTINIVGTDFGTFTFEKEQYQNDVNQSAQTAVFADIPVAPTSIARLSVDASGSVGQMNIDIDGDGSVDQTLTAGMDFDPIIYLEMMKKTIISMHLSASVEKALMKKIQKVEKDIQSGKIKQAKQKIKALLKNIALRHGHKKHIDEGDKKHIQEMFDQLLDDLN